MASALYPQCFGLLTRQGKEKSLRHDSNPYPTTETFAEQEFCDFYNP